MQENLSEGFVNNTGADQPAQSEQRLCYLLFGKYQLATGEISIFLVVSIAEKTGLSETLKTGFLAPRPI